MMKPEKLSWVTIPLIINMVLGVLGLLALPFMGAIINGIFGAAVNSGDLSGDDAAGLGIARAVTGGTLWVSFIIGLAWLAFEFFTLRAVQEGRSWGRVAAIVIFILSLLSFPIGTILGIFGLIGAFDQDVQRFASR